MKFEKFTTHFLEYLEVVKNVSDHTFRNYAIDLKDFHFFLEKKIFEKEKILIKSITKWTIRQYLAYLRERKLKDRTVMRKISSLRSFFKYLQKEKLINQNPLLDIESPKRKRLLPKTLAYDQVELLFQVYS